MKDAAVVCKELGCGAALSAPVAQFWEGSSPVVVFDIRCRGRESAVREYPGTWGNYSRLPRSFDAGVICSDALQKPTISLEPNSRVFVRGEVAQISCSGNYRGSNFSLYRDGESITSKPAPGHSNAATFPPLEIRAGNHWCKYTKLVGGRELTSPESERLGIKVRDPLQKPNITLKPNSREFVRGKSAEISCSGNYVSSDFSLYRDGEFIISQTAPENNKTAIFTISEISAGNYTCNYTTVIDGREFTSPESERLGISVSGKSSVKSHTITSDVTLDPQTAHPKLTVSEDLKRVSLLHTPQGRDANETRFDVSICVLGLNGFTSGRHYWEVQVANQTEWDVPVARVSVNRKTRTAVAPEEGYWAVTLTYRGEYEALTKGRTTLPMTQRFGPLGVYLDWEIGRVSFYNVDNTSHLHTFYSVFTEKVYPYFRPGLSDDGKSSGMLEISREKQDTNRCQLFPCFRGRKNVKEREQYRLTERNP
ncbi:E3 ubiquitin-protein ligase TRIM17-like [Callorhinchus milii]|uniref:E3 ubiquitin-protein ligase TRIM17-like n=1 Tax=Callorhinchus milii TaxID=7868 RepID=UPI001C3FAB95|nr:E3 ubiquitin-protein ligase TRIM17-like [Callorhinchus milii]